MHLLSFEVSNFKSIRGTVVLDLVKPGLKTQKPKPGQGWRQHIWTVAAILGPNASGKSSILQAINHAQNTIRGEFARVPRGGHSTMHRPFLLDEQRRHQRSSFIFDFVIDEIRHEYGFEVSPAGVEKEWLSALPKTKWRTLFTRDYSRGDSSDVAYGKGTASVGPVGRQELVLTRALDLEHTALSTIARELLSGIEIAPHGDLYRQDRLQAITHSLGSQGINLSEVETLLVMADVGIQGVSVAEERLPASAVRIRHRILEVIEEVVAEEHGKGEKSPPSLTEEESEAFVKILEFDHQGATGRRALHVEDESDGTIAWLSLSVPAVAALRRGAIFCVDELDASLHPQLLASLIALFGDEQTNRHGAQLIFTAHNPYLLSPQSALHLDPDQVWLTEKDSDGATSLFSLSDFDIKKDNNVAKQYLSGRFGGLPLLATSMVHGLLQDDAPSPVPNLPNSFRH